jgi:hypothetical protein
MNSLNEGDQIIYVPRHANGDINHPDCEKGFITSVRGNTAFCRYFSKYNTGLRTLSCSEATPTDLLVKQRHHSQRIIDKLMEKINDGTCSLH